MAPAVATISGFIIPDGDSFPKTTGARKMARAVATVSGFLIPDGDSFPKTTGAHKMARSVETESGFIIPNGDGFPTTTHSSVTPPHNVESAIPTASTTGLPAAGSSVVPSSAFTSLTTAPVASQEAAVDQNAELFPRGAVIAIIVLAVLAIIGVAFFLVRFYFVRRRISKVTPARARASQTVISGPVNFQHVSSADGNPPLWNTSDKVSMMLGTAQAEPHGHPDLRAQTDLPEKAVTASEKPYGRKNQKYSVNFGELDSGLHDQVQNMQSARNPRQDRF